MDSDVKRKVQFTMSITAGDKNWPKKLAAVNMPMAGVIKSSEIDCEVRLNK